MRIKEKLKNHSGASMIFALALMLVCVVVSSVILAAATSGASRNFSRTKQQSDYLAISSAAEFLQESLKDPGYLKGETMIDIHQCNVYRQFGEQTVTIGSNTYVGYPISWNVTGGYIEKLLLISEEHPFCESKKELQIIEKSFSGPFASLMECAAVQVFETDTIYKETFYLTVETETGEEERIPEVRCDFTMNQAYNVYIDIYVESDSSDYAMQLFVPAEKKESSFGETNDSICTHPILLISTNEAGQVVVDPDAAQDFLKVNDCPTIEVTWGTPTLEKGVE